MRIDDTQRHARFINGYTHRIKTQPAPGHPAVPAHSPAAARAIVLYLYLSGHMFRAEFAKGPIPDLAEVVWMVALTLTVYGGFVHVMELRPARELALPGMGRELGIGLLLGAGLYTVCILTLMVFGVYRIDGFNSWQIPIDRNPRWSGLRSTVRFTFNQGLPWQP